MPREAFLMIIAAMIAGAIGFGIAVYAVPLEEIVQFRALIDAGLGAISTPNHSNGGNTGRDSTTAPPSNASKELDNPQTQSRSGSNSDCYPHNVNCVGGSPTGAAAPSEIPNRDRNTESSQQNERGDNLQGPALKEEPASPPSSAPTTGSEKTHTASGGHSKQPKKKGKLKFAPQRNSEH